MISYSIRFATFYSFGYNFDYPISYLSGQIEDKDSLNHLINKIFENVASSFIIDLVIGNESIIENGTWVRQDYKVEGVKLMSILKGGSN